MENISFTGIKNLYIGKNCYNKFGSYVSSLGEIKQGEKEVTEMKIKCQLTDNKDVNGNDLSDFFRCLSKSGQKYLDNCVDKSNPDTLDLFIRRNDIKDDIEKVSYSTFKVNGFDLLAASNKVMPLFTYLAKFTREIVPNSAKSENQKAFLRLANRSICEEVSKYFEL